MITLTREEAQQVLDALEIEQEAHVYLQLGKADHIENAIEVLRARLSAPEPSIVEDAIVYGTGITMGGNRIDPDSIYKEPEPPCKTGSQCIGGKCPQCVVSEPEPAAWMNESDMGRTDWKVWAHGKPTATVPLYTAPPQREWQEPHSWYSAEHDEWMTDKTRKEHERLNSYTHKVGGFDLPLYATQPAAQRQWQSLTDEEITALKRNGERYISSQDFARAIEAKLKEKNA